MMLLKNVLFFREWVHGRQHIIMMEPKILACLNRKEGTPSVSSKDFALLCKITDWVSELQYMMGPLESPDSRAVGWIVMMQYCINACLAVIGIASESWPYMSAF